MYACGLFSCTDSGVCFHSINTPCMYFLCFVYILYSINTGAEVESDRGFRQMQSRARSRECERE